MLKLAREMVCLPLPGEEETPEMGAGKERELEGFSQSKGEHEGKSPGPQPMEEECVGTSLRKHHVRGLSR